MLKTILFIACVLIGSSVGSFGAGSSAPVARAGSGLAANTTQWPVEVRMRRLHLARPDLIPYPLDIEVVC